MKPRACPQFLSCPLAVLAAAGALTALGAMPGVGQERIAAPEQNAASQEKTAAPPLSALEHLQVREFRFEGNTAFSKEQLASVTSAYLNRDISAEDLEEARRAVTLHYVRNGFINSGALLKDQPLGDGVVTFTVVEGALTQTEVSGNRRYHAGFLKRQIRHAAAPPFNVTRIRDQLQILRQNSNISRINADVQPGAQPGQAVLHLEIEEARPVHTAIQFDNHRPASIGAERFRLVTTNSNLTGRDDVFDLRTGLTRGSISHSSFAGLHDFALAYTSPSFDMPLFGSQTNLLLNFGKNDAGVIEEPFRTLDISSRFENYSAGLRHLQSKTLGGEKSLSLSVEHRQSTTFLGGQPFSFSRGDVNGEAQTTALRLGQEFLQRDQNHVFAARALLSLGAGFPGSTKNAAAPNGHFLILLGQAQCVKVLGDSGRQLLLRANGQWANRPLLTVEQFSVGGADSVRGYRENQLVRDVGFTASAELRVPVAVAKSGANILVLAPFADFGYGANLKAPASSGPKTIGSIGLGAIYTPGRRLNAQIYYGYPLRRVASSGHDLQDKGLHFSVVWNFS